MTVKVILSAGEIQGSFFCKNLTKTGMFLRKIVIFFLSDGLTIAQNEG